MSGSQKQEQNQKALGWAAGDSSGTLSPFHFTRRHEIVGVVNQVGCKVNKFKTGDKAAVGLLTNSCDTCNNCKDDLEVYCPKVSFTYTLYEGKETKNYGGFSDIIVVNEKFALKFLETLSPEGVAPLLCAGITVYIPMKYYGLNEPGKHLGVVGLRGLGHLAVKFAKAFGMKVTVISTSPSKKHKAIEQLVANYFVAAMGTLDGIIDTASLSNHSINPFIDPLKRDGKLILVGAPDMKKPLELVSFPLLVGRKMVGGSIGGGLKEAQEMLDFAGKHDVTATVEVIPMDYVNTAMDRLAKGDIRCRFVIDIGNSLIA